MKLLKTLQEMRALSNKIDKAKREGRYLIDVIENTELIKQLVTMVNKSPNLSVKLTLPSGTKLDITDTVSSKNTNYDPFGEN